MSLPATARHLDFNTPLGTWRLSSAAPSTALAGVVREFWEVRGTLKEFREAVLPNGQTEVMFNLGPQHRVLDGPGAGTWDHSWFSGLQERAIQIESLEGTHLVAARLDPIGAAELLGEGVPRAANSVVHLERLIGAEADALRRALLAAASPEQRFGILERFLESGLGDRKPIPDFVVAVARAIEARHGRVAIGDVQSEAGVSRKHLAASFNRFIGISPKRYAVTQRFIWTLGRLQSEESVDWSELSADAGYADQSHLVRDFRRVGAASPNEYLRRALPGRTALLEESDR